MVNKRAEEVDKNKHIRAENKYPVRVVKTHRKRSILQDSVTSEGEQEIDFLFDFLFYIQINGSINKETFIITPNIITYQAKHAKQERKESGFKEL